MSGANALSNRFGLQYVLPQDSAFKYDSRLAITNGSSHCCRSVRWCCRRSPPNPQHALWTVIVSYVLWGTGVPLAMLTLGIYFHRLTMHKLPPKEVIVSVFLPLGPLGQGGYALMQLGKVSMQIFPKTDTLVQSAGLTLYVLGFIVALIMWGFGLVWLFFALASISRSKFPFNMGWWGFTFPIGVFTVATTTFGKEIPSRFFNVLGTVRGTFETYN